MARIGLLGGCFNPVHNGHIRLAIEVLEQLGLDRVEFLPAAVPPHKPGEGMLDFAARVELVEAAVAGIDGLAVNTVEAEREGPSFTVDTLEYLNTTRPDDDFWFVLGACDLQVLPKWNRGMRIPQLANLAVSNRVEDDLERVTALMASKWPDAEKHSDSRWRFASGHELSFIEVPRLDVSSSTVRERLLGGRSIRGLVPESVENLLGEHQEHVAKVWES